MKKTVTVFAATGVAGSACVEELLQQGVFNVQVLARKPGQINGTGTVYTYSGSRGLLRDDDEDEFDDSDHVGTRGILRASDNHLQCGSLRGHPVRLHSDSGNVRIEFFRTTGNFDEIPSRFVRAVEDYACGSVLTDEGPGQDRALGALYNARFQTAVERLRHRVNKIRQQRTATFGGLTGRGSTPYARLPQKYPEQGE